MSARVVTGALLVVGLAALIGCSRDADPAPSAQPEPAISSPAEARSQRVDPRDQYQLVADLAAAQQTDPEEDPDAYGRVVRAWQGKRYTWELAIVPVLCRRADQCLVAPIDHRRLAQPVMRGWLPRLELDEAEHAALMRGCEGKSRCVVRVEATMRELVADEEAPTRLTLDVSAIAGARAARRDESWVVRGG